MLHADMPIPMSFAPFRSHCCLLATYIIKQSLLINALLFLSEQGDREQRDCRHNGVQTEDKVSGDGVQRKFLRPRLPVRVQHGRDPVNTLPSGAVWVREGAMTRVTSRGPFLFTFMAVLARARACVYVCNEKIRFTAGASYSVQVKSASTATQARLRCVEAKMAEVSRKMPNVRSEFRGN